jgi:two-component system, OmpR family, phosphate regulon sensor histidine kinase PhoR
VNFRSPISHNIKRIKRNAFLLIVLINSVALIGIISTQIYWIKDAYDILNEQFTNTVKVSLKGVVNQLLADELKKTADIRESGQDEFIPFKPDVMNLNQNRLESIINEAFRSVEVGKYYEYAIIDAPNHKLLTGKFDRYAKELLNSQYKVKMDGFSNQENYFLSAWFPEQSNIVMRSLLDWIVISGLFAFVLIIGFPVSLYIFNRQKRISDMKSDFINNMTHEFKTPIATISLASEMLMKKSIREDEGKTQRYARIIYDENTRLQNHVEQILSVSLLERGRFRLKKREVNVNEIIREAVENFGIAIKDRNGEIKTHYCAKDFMINADKEHLMNVIINLLDNANKYSPGNPWIRIGTQSIGNGIIISVEDRGVGISLENQQQVFKKLYRVPTGNLYNQKGFGIGLYYVKTIIEAHGGHINIKSELNKGSRFDVFLPFDHKPAKEDEYNQT